MKSAKKRKEPPVGEPLTIENAPRSEADLLLYGRYRLRNLAMYLGMGSTPETRAALTCLTTAELAHMVAKRLGQVDAGNTAYSLQSKVHELELEVTALKGAAVHMQDHISFLDSRRKQLTNALACAQKYLTEEQHCEVLHKLLSSVRSA